MKKKEVARKGLHPLEIVFYSISGCTAITGLVFLILGIITQHAKDRNSNLVLNEAKIVLDYRIWGIILIAAAALIAVIVLAIFAQSADRAYEKTLRRQQRLSAAKISEMEIKPAVQKIEVESNPEKKEE